MSISQATLTAEVVKTLEIDNTDLSRFKVYEHLNQAQLFLLNKMPAKHLTAGIATATFNLVSGQTLYQWPSDFLRLIQIWLNYSASVETSEREASRWDSDQFLRSFNAMGTVNFPFYDARREAGFAISPAPSADQATGGRIQYVQRHPEISATQDSLMDARFKNLLIYRAVALSALVEDYSPNLNERYMALFEQELENFMPKVRNV